MNLRKSALLFVSIGLLLYACLAAGSEWLLYRHGHSNAFFKIATAPTMDYDWTILGASHAMPLDFSDFNSVMEKETELKIINLSSVGTGPLYNRFALESFLKTHSTRNILYVVDSFSFWYRAWNEDRFADAKLVRGTPLSGATATLFFKYVRDDHVSPIALLDYLTFFSKVNNRNRFDLDVWEGESQFQRVYQSSTTAVTKRISYLYPGPRQPKELARYLAAFSELIDIARQGGANVILVRLPTLTQFRSRLPDETAFDTALTSFAAEHKLRIYDLSAELDEPRYYFDTDHLNRAGLTELFQRRLKPLLMSRQD